MPREISAIQQLYLDLIKLSSFNDFDGPAVVASLLEHRDVWHSATMIREQDDYHIVLRDLPRYNNVDALFIAATPGQEAALEALAETWHADEIDWEPEKIPDMRVDMAVLRVWWD
jgi:hypothetical protein